MCWTFNLSEKVSWGPKGVKITFKILTAYFLVQSKTMCKISDKNNTVEPLI